MRKEAGDLPHYKAVIRLKTGLGAGIVNGVALTTNAMQLFLDRVSGCAKYNCPVEEIAGMQARVLISYSADRMRIHDWKCTEEQKKKNRELCISLACLFAIGVGTSIDAFSGGISLKLSENGILYPAIVIGAITYINSVLGFNTGRNIKHMPVMYLEISAGIILILLGIKALI
jgi:putative Mn2+ efflux pump MntP